MSRRSPAATHGSACSPRPRCSSWRRSTALYLGWRVIPLARYITPERGIGYALGIAGGGLMLLLLLYPATQAGPLARLHGLGQGVVQAAHGDGHRRADPGALSRQLQPRRRQQQRRAGVHAGRRRQRARRPLSLYEDPRRTVRSPDQPRRAAAACGSPAPSLPVGAVPRGAPGTAGSSRNSGC